MIKKNQTSQDFGSYVATIFHLRGKKKNNITKKYSVGSKDRKNERGIVEKNTEEIRWKGKEVMFKTEADTTSGISRQR